MLITVNSSTKYFAARQECKRHPMLPFHGNIEHFYTVNSSATPTKIKGTAALLFHSNNCYANATKRNTLRTLSTILC